MEYVEITNVSSNTLDMSNVSFTLGITYTIPGGTLLGVGSKLVIAKDLTAFATTFGSGINVVGPFLGQLDNAGEVIEMRRADGSLLLNFTYDDAIPWPTIADGDGHSLELISPFSLPNLSDPLSWRASATNNGGNPGIDGAITYAAWKIANGNHTDDQDLDGDGLSTMLEYCIGGNPQTAEQSLRPTFIKEPAGTFLMSITRSVNAQQASVIPEGATNLNDWSDANYILISNDRLTSPAGVDRLTFRITPPPNRPRYFSRFRFSM
jgi:hypothetical protein